MRTNGDGYQLALRLAVVALLTGATAGSALADEYFLALDGIPGESKDSKHKDTIEIESFSFGAGAAQSGGRAGRVQLQDIQFIKRLDKASPLLFKALAQGGQIPRATLSARKKGQQQDYYTITLQDVLVSSYSVSGSQSSDSLPVDQFSLNFTKVTVSYSPQRADGSFDAPITSSVDVRGR